MALAFSILPIVLTILCGHMMVRTRILPRGSWTHIETLSFRLLIPVVLIKSIAVSDISFSEFGPTISAIIGVLVLLGLGLLLLKQLVFRQNMANPTFTTLFQTGTRWNAFIALAAAELFVGPSGLTLIAVAMAVLIPLINIANIIVLVIFGTARTNVRGIMMMVLKNPLVQACAIGLAINFSGFTLPQSALQTLDLIGRAALGVGLLAVGAGIDPARLFKTSSPMWFGVVLRLVIAPLLFLGVSQMIGLNQIQTLIGILILAVPAASNGYIVAKQMGGDYELYADILAWQTVLSMLVLPLYAVYLAR